ncbi:MAG: hypothetical protein M9953_01510 [Thermomicrobiales bacterium]|nr:hypothetical protein [Thermomicrobiales bacterium]
MTTAAREQLDAIASSLRSLHKLLLDREKRIYEKDNGRLDNPYQLLNLAMNDPQFAWLRALSGEMAHLDDVRLDRNGITPESVRLLGTRLRALVDTNENPTEFQQQYNVARDEDPDIMLAHGALMRSLPPAPTVDLFLSAGNEQDDKDPLPGAVRPGTLVPGYGDKGYHAFGAIDERGLQAGIALKSIRYSNEIVLDIASTAMDWSAGFTADPWSPVLVQAGTGIDIGRTAQGDGVLLSLYFRPVELGGEPAVIIPEVEEEHRWFRLADETTLGTGAAVWTCMAAASAVLQVPTIDGCDTCLYVLAGTIEIDGVHIPDSRLALVRSPHDLRATCVEDSMIVAVLVRRDAEVTKAGSVAR